MDISNNSFLNDFNKLKRKRPYFPDGGSVSDNLEGIFSAKVISFDGLDEGEEEEEKIQRYTVKIRLGQSQRETFEISNCTVVNQKMSQIPVDTVVLVRIQVGEPTLILSGGIISEADKWDNHYHDSFLIRAVD